MYNWITALIYTKLVDIASLDFFSLGVRCVLTLLHCKSGVRRLARLTDAPFVRQLLRTSELLKE